MTLFYKLNKIKMKSVILKIIIIAIFLLITGCNSKIIIIGNNEVRIGEEINLFTNSNDTFKWKSSDTNIATVDDGIVTGINIGAVTISILTNEKIVATYNVNVIERNPIFLSGNSEVRVGEEIILFTSVKGKYVWKSSDENIATVDEGKVTGIRRGIVTISIFNDETELASYSLKVIEDNFIEISGKTFLLVDEETALTVTSNFDYDEAIWISSDEYVATVTNGIVRGLNEGDVTIYVLINGLYVLFDIKVIRSYAPKSIKIDPVLEEYIVGDGPYKLTATAYPEYAYQDFNWEISGGKATINKDTGELNILEDGDIHVICRSKHNDYVYSIATLKAKYSDDVKFTRILFIGNSLTYRNDIPSIVKNMGIATGKVIKTVSITPGGNTLADILNGYSSTIHETLKKDHFDYMIIQEASSANFLYYSSFLKSAVEFKQIADTYNTTLLLYQTWAYKENSTLLNNLQISRETMQDFIKEAYRNVSYEIDADINPVGEIFYRFSLAYPDIELYADDNHASLAGSYLSSCVHYISLFKESVIGNEYAVKLPDDVKLLIQTFVTNYLLG